MTGNPFLPRYICASLSPFPVVESAKAGPPLNTAYYYNSQCGTPQGPISPVIDGSKSSVSPLHQWILSLFLSLASVRWPLSRSDSGASIISLSLSCYLAVHSCLCNKQQLPMTNPHEPPSNHSIPLKSAHSPPCRHPPPAPPWKCAPAAAGAAAHTAPAAAAGPRAPRSRPSA